MILYEYLSILKREYGINYMGFRVWIGLWTAFFLIVVVVTDSSVLVKYITRFTGKKDLYFSIIKNSYFLFNVKRKALLRLLLSYLSKSRSQNS